MTLEIFDYSTKRYNFKATNNQKSIRNFDYVLTIFKLDFE